MSTPTISASSGGDAGIHLDVYGYRVELRGDPAQAVENVAADFAHFRCEPGHTELVIELLQQSPPYDEAPPLRASVYTPRNVSFRDGDCTYVDYSGRGLAVHDRRASHLRLYSQDPDLLYEAAYLFVLSQLAEQLDARRLHRVHALGVALAGRAALVLLPMGGGKSTLGAELLKYPDVHLLSDDSPLVDRQGRVHPFPLRLGLLPGGEGGIPDSELRLVDRMEFGPKVLVNYRYFADRVCPRAEPGAIFLGSRSLSRTCRILPASGAAALRSMIANCVVGLGLFHGLEFLLSRSPAEIASKAVLGFSRLRTSLRLIRRSRCFHLVLGRDTQQNGRTLVEFLRREFPAADG
ncbi:MAG: hypothetical protein FJW34_23960 [Acidobacteria bacterium]|nr:hypothetical protein [Acidobacteriota bacterium]